MRPGSFRNIIIRNIVANSRKISGKQQSLYRTLFSGYVIYCIFSAATIQFFSWKIPLPKVSFQALEAGTRPHGCRCPRSVACRNLQSGSVQSQMPWYRRHPGCLYHHSGCPFPDCFLPQRPGTRLHTWKSGLSRKRPLRLQTMHPTVLLLRHECG